MSYARQVQFNPGEQILSSDFNNLQGFAGQELSDLTARLVSSDFLSGAFTGVLAGLGNVASGGVLTGLTVAPGGLLTVVVQPGLGFDINTSPPALGTGEAASQSAFRWIRVDAGTTGATLAGPPFASPGSGSNCYLVQAIDNAAPQTNQSRNVWVVTSNSVQAQSLTKEVDPNAPTLTVVGPTTFPALPTLSAGNIPLALVVIPSSVTTITTAMIYDLRHKYVPKGRFLHGVINGLELQWVGSNTLSLSPGSGYAYGQPFAFSGSTPATFSSAAFRVDAATGPASGHPLAASTNYYCYLVPSGTAFDGTIIPAATFADFAGGSEAALVISPTPPNPDGGISAAITVSATTSRPGFSVSTVSAVFVGSIMSNASGDIIAFRRLGNDVYAIPPITPGGGGIDSGLGVSNVVTFTTGGGTFQNGTLAWGPGAGTPTLAAVPASAKAAIIDLVVAGVGVTSNNYVSILDPLSTVGGPTEQAQAQILSNQSGASQINNARMSLVHATPTAGETAVTVQAATAPTGASILIDGVLRGYVEDVRHPNVAAY